MDEQEVLSYKTISYHCGIMKGIFFIILHCENFVKHVTNFHLVNKQWTMIYF